MALSVNVGLFRWMNLVGDKMFMGFADEVVELCGARQASGKAPHLPVAGASMVSSFSERAQAGFLFLDDVTALHAMGLYCILWFGFVWRTLWSRGAPVLRLGGGFLNPGGFK